MKKLTLKNLVWKEGKYYVAQCMNVDVSSFGKTKAEALKNLNEALDLFFEDEKNISFSQVERPEIITAHVRYA
ncbi:MAG TPA: type II toxin-antitoxin system HicB family antitoxin [Bacteroidia bacterium]|nr:type II toxin-antitoxin system HicB family antitoxin [Bacteroidia bacterium]